MLTATGWWMYIDVPMTPQAVVACVIVYNAAFGFRYVLLSDYFLVLTPSLTSAGVLFRGCTRQRRVYTELTAQIGGINVTIDYASQLPRKGRLNLYCYQLGLQLPCW
jgi:hypothetical protein